jgi:hypothetical protein
MAILGFQSMLVFLALGSRLFDHFHIDDVVAAIDAVRPVPS